MLSGRKERGAPILPKLYAPVLMPAQEPLLKGEALIGNSSNNSRDTSLSNLRAASSLNKFTHVLT